jgi:peptide/nickel transport system substrate-binding protein
MTTKRIAGTVASAAALLLIATACSSAAPAAESSDTTLRLALSSDMTTLDPSTVYQFEGNQVLTAVYEGLLEYASDSSPDIEPLLAESYTVSDDGHTYTFALRTDVTFADGSTMTSADVQQSFERLGVDEVGSQMAYMLMGVASYETPDDATLVITLAQPDASFLSLLASPFGPKVIDPAVLDEYSADNALEYLSGNTAGTGPYEVTQFTEGQEYVLTRNDDYWGDEPYFETLSFAIIPDAATQVLQLQGGDLDLITGQPIATVQSFVGNDEFQIPTLPTLLKAQLHLQTTGNLADVEVREALRSAIDRPALVEQIWGEYAAESTQLYPVDNVPAGTATDEWEYDTAPLEELAADTTFSLGYVTGSAQNKQVVEALQAQWAAAGAEVTLVPLQSGDLYGFSGDLSAAPDMIYETAFPDSSHPDTWARLFWYSDTSMGSGALNYIGGGTPEADAAIDAGISTVDPAESLASYGDAGDLIEEQASFITLADLEDTFIARAGLSGFAHWLPAASTVDLRELTGE